MSTVVGAGSESGSVWADVPLVGGVGIAVVLLVFSGGASSDGAFPGSPGCVALPFCSARPSLMEMNEPRPDARAGIRSRSFRPVTL